MTDYVTTVEALTIHTDQIERYGGLAGDGATACWKARSCGLRMAIISV